MLPVSPYSTWSFSEKHWARPYKVHKTQLISFCRASHLIDSSKSIRCKSKCWKSPLVAELPHTNRLEASPQRCFLGCLWATFQSWTTLKNYLVHIDWTNCQERKIGVEGEMWMRVHLRGVGRFDWVKDDWMTGAGWLQWKIASLHRCWWWWWCTTSQRYPPTDSWRATWLLHWSTEWEIWLQVSAAPH